MAKSTQKTIITPPSSHRSPDQTTLTISMEKELKARIQVAAAQDSRTVSNWCSLALDQACSKPKKKK